MIRCRDVSAGLVIAYAIVLFLVPRSVPVAALTVEDSLWQRAIAVYEANAEWQPRLITVETREYDGRGNLRHEETTVTRQYLADDGEIESELVSVIRDGEDITEERRENPRSNRSFGPPAGSADEAESSSDGFEPVYTSIFDPEQQPYVEYRRTDRTRAVDGRRAVAFDFTHRPNESAGAEGTVWIATDSGAPLVIESSLEPPVVFLQELAYVYRFETDGSEWRLRTMQFDVEAGLLMFRRDFDIRMTFSDYFHAPGVDVGDR
ncbi:MAG: hypothetical protein ACOCYG_05170 [Spirochaetota bacterium]